MAVLRITQTRSHIGRTQSQRATLRSLGLKRIRHTVEQPDRPEIRGMIATVSHLVVWEEVDAATPASSVTPATAAEPSGAAAVGGSGAADHEEGQR